MPDEGDDGRCWSLVVACSEAGPLGHEPVTLRSNAAATAKYGERLA